MLDRVIDYCKMQIAKRKTKNEQRGGTGTLAPDAQLLTPDASGDRHISGYLTETVRHLEFTEDPMPAADCPLCGQRGGVSIRVAPPEKIEPRKKQPLTCQWCACYECWSLFWVWWRTDEPPIVFDPLLNECATDHLGDFKRQHPQRWQAVADLQREYRRGQMRVPSSSTIPRPLEPNP